MGVLESMSVQGDSFNVLALRLFSWSQSGGRVGLLFTLLLRLLCGVDLPRGLSVGSGLRLPHGSRGTVVHPCAQLGDRVTLFQNVTIGVAHLGGPVPKIGDDVLVGAGACVLGGITVGDGAVIGANAVVLHDVPAGATAVGVPARVLCSV